MLGWYTVDQYFLLVCKVFVLLAGCASFDIVGYPLIHVRPPIPFLGLADGFISSWVASCGVVVHQGHDATFYFGDGWYMDFAFWCDSGHNESFGVKQPYSLIVSFTFVRSRKPRECVRWDVGFAWDIEDFVVVFLKVCVPSCRSSVEVPWGFPVLEVGVVSHDGEGVFSPSQVRSPVCEGFHHG